MHIWLILGTEICCCDQGNKALGSINMSNFLNSNIVVRFSGRDLSHRVVWLVGWLGFVFLNSAYVKMGI